MMNIKKTIEAQKLKEKISQLDELEMYSVYQILEKNNINMTNNMNGIYFDLLALPSDIYITIEKFINQSLQRKELLNQNN